MFGSKVYWTTPDGYSGHGIVIGVMDFGADVVCVATEDTDGMTINAAHCRAGDQVDLALAHRLRARYVEKYGERFRALADPAAENAAESGSKAGESREDRTGA